MLVAVVELFGLSTVICCEVSEVPELEEEFIGVNERSSANSSPASTLFVMMSLGVLLKGGGSPGGGVGVRTKYYRKSQKSIP